jgi:uncharacterized protein YbcV (DUF1398 family)
LLIKIVWVQIPPRIISFKSKLYTIYIDIKEKIKPLKKNRINIMKNNNNNNNNNNSNNNKENIMSFSPVRSYTKADLRDICKDNNKAGIYKWTHIISGKSYVGSAINLSNRFKNYYNIAYLERETAKNNSMIYKALLKYGYSSFKLDILEYCNPDVLIEREQYYLDHLKPEYNILKFARSIAGFKHSEASINLIRETKLGRGRSEAAKLKIAAGNIQAQLVVVTDNKTGESKEFTSIRKAAKFIGIHHSYVAKIIKTHKAYVGKIYTITKK